MWYQVLEERKIKYIVAPYEADAQLAHMALNGVIDFAIAEDSDLLLYRCPIVFLKMDQSGTGQEIKLRNLGAAEELNLLGWTHEQFVEMCILSGCDYCPGLSGLGLKSAHKLIKKYKSAKKLFRAVQKGFEVLEGTSAEYIAQYTRAQLVFRHQRVYNIATESVCMLTPMIDDQLAQSDLNFLGPAGSQSSTLKTAVRKYDDLSQSRAASSQSSTHRPAVRKCDDLRHSRTPFSEESQTVQAKRKSNENLSQRNRKRRFARTHTDFACADLPDTKNPYLRRYL